MASKFGQRARKPNYTKEETETLLNQLILYGQCLFNKNQPVNNQQKADVWANIAMQVNAVPNSAGRTIDELKHRWQDMAQRARAALRKSSGDIGDAPVKPVPFLDKIFKIIGELPQDIKLHHDESLVASLDSTHSSDSSFANELKPTIKEEIDNQKIKNTNTVIDFSHSSGSTRAKTRKRSCPEVTSFMSQASYQSLPPLDKANNSLPPISNNPSPALFKDSENYKEQFESKRRRMKNSSNPRKSVSLPSSNTNKNHDESLYEYETTRVQHKHIETFRSMVLDPDSEIVMEVGDTAGENGGGGGDDGGSWSSCFSNSNLSTHNNSYQEDKGNDHYGQQHQRLKESRPATISPAQQYLPVDDNGNQTIGRSKQLPGLTPLLVNNNKNIESLPHLYHPVARSSSQDIPLPHSTLDILTKSDLERQCLISQIRMQDQQTRYFLMKEKKVRLEIELLNGKCVYKNNSSNDNSVEENLIPSTSFSPINQPNTLLQACSPCNLSISSVTSCNTNSKTKTNNLDEGSVNSEQKDQSNIESDMNVLIESMQEENSDNIPIPQMSKECDDKNDDDDIKIETEEILQEEKDRSKNFENWL